MVLAKSKNAVGLGNSLMNDRFGKGKGSDMRKVQGIKRTAPDGSTYVTTERQEASWVKMRSVTEQAALDEFLSTAELAGTDFTAEKMNNVKIIHKDQKNPYLLSATEERASIRKQKANREKLTVPRRPKWDKNTTAQALDDQEKLALLEWRRGLAELQETNDLLMTPFERNLEVWRQLWRVIERSDLVVQIVDARNPLMFRSEDLESYVKAVDPKKNNLLLVNKADMMTLPQRQAWADYFEDVGINFRFFSAELAKIVNESRESDVEDEEDDDEEAEDDVVDGEEVGEEELAKIAEKMNVDDDQEVDIVEKTSVKDDHDADDGESDWASDDEVEVHHDTTRGDGSFEDERTRILTTDELEALFLEHSPEVDTGQEGHDGQHRKTQIGLVGYPNVGKSSTINALIGAKKVSVSATPGKTKHFQTIHLSDSVILCDCPGLVFPNFASTKAELVCNGVLPIDQLREYTGPAALVAQRIPRAFLEAIYGMKIAIRPVEEGGTGIPTGEEVLRAYATARGYQTQGLGQPDESRAARYVLKDYVKGKLLYCHPPPADPPIDGRQFNRDLYDAAHLPEKRRQRLALHRDVILDGMNDQDVSLPDDMGVVAKPTEGRKTRFMDSKFFAPGQNNAGHLIRPKYSEQGTDESGKVLVGRKATTMLALERDVDPADLKALSSKKHFKANKRKGKARTEYTS